MTMQVATAPAVRHIDAFESKPCTRCGGTGTYSFTPMYGSTCFKCGGRPYVPGTGFVLTKLGAQALEAWRTANTDMIPAGDLVPGNEIVIDGGRRRRVVAVNRDGTMLDTDTGLMTYGWSTSMVGGVSTKTVWDIGVVTGDGVTHCMNSTSIVSRWTPRQCLMPPVMPPGTKRAAEMRAYVKTAAAVRGA